MSWIGGVYAMAIMACLSIRICICGCSWSHEVFVARKMFSSPTSTFFNITMSLESFLNILQLSSTSVFGVACVVCWLKKKSQGKFNTIKSRTIPPLPITKYSAHRALRFALWQRPLKVSRLVFRVRRSRELDRLCRGYYGMFICRCICGCSWAHEGFG